ncbi:hypothetical protein JCM31826_20700 [Thermaurantimonas aggregans]|uniref:Methyltransferase domain-containing protein n=1 Tax=Thermaurantimonas aggregans TaxID=2173829 RepID=A0A401XNI5_9FLAO|nr:class I SAM-dependent methyltransferase [Thermaurantimonas aggregans]MCX8148453.1 class I SAM-dependent methyltransferase [Thermaurantimonas aggregans]GCD78588.1 hypothetical protein JCM31826_20700 [Thermaurantimonas aggregans]
MDGNIESQKNSADKTSPEYWDAFWETNQIPDEIVINKKHINSYLYTEFDAFFRKHIETGQERKLIELGCGNSVWLPYFFKNFNLIIYGLDYSDLGCQRSRFILKKYNTPGKIFEGDLFLPSDELKGKFDYVVSFGVIEHFRDTVEVLKAHAQYLNDTGKIFVSVPNMCGFPGWYQKVMNRAVFDTHMPIDNNYLKNALQKAGFKNIDIQYVLPIAVSAQIDGAHKTSFVSLKKFLTLNLSRLTKILWAFEIYTSLKLPRTRTLSPALIAYAEKE